MKLRLTHIALVLAASAAEVSAAEPGLLALYTFEEGAGAVLKDHSGKGHDGSVHNAQWVKSIRGRGLAFKSTGSYVDCGVELGGKLTADMTILAWVRLAAAPYPDGTTNWTVVDCEDYTKSGFIVRIDGQATKLYYRASSAGRTPESYSRASIPNGVYHHLAVTRQGNRVTLLVDGLPETPFTANPPASPSASLKISSASQSLQGTMDYLAIYGRALPKHEVLARYKRDAAAYGKDTSWFGKLQLEPFLYLDRAKATVAVDFLGVLPVPPGAEAAVELSEPDKPAVRAIKATATAESGKQDFSFDLAGLPAGDYEIRAVLRDALGKTITQKAVGFRYPPAPVKVPKPAERALPPLPAAPKPPSLGAEVGPDGGLTVRANGQSYPVVAEFSYPGGGFNVLGQSSASGNRTEAAWKPTTEQLGPSMYRITAAGQHYALSRRIEVQPRRVVVSDTITNRTAGSLGVLVRNHIAAPPGAVPRVYVGGYPSSGNVTARAIKTNPTIFLAWHDMGLGLVALDDVLIVQSLATVQGGIATLHSDTFALDKHASYTLEWAIYPTPSGDYYDFINQVRRDEGRNGTVDGGLGFISRGPGDRRGVPSRQSVELRNLKYGIIHCLSYAADDPGVSIEGIEFIDFPKERKLLKEQIAAIHKAYPGMKVTFHVAHALYATNKPDRVFPDSRMIDAAGKQTVYTANPAPYFTKERFDQGWNWYIYYPTLENSFGRAMLRSIDVIMDEIGADGPFMDGFLWTYGGEYTYDRWDGHTAQIDPKTKTITRKMGSVLLLSQDALVAFCRKIRDKGGVVIANGAVITRTIARESYILHDRECFAGPEVHLSPTPMTLSLPSAISQERDIYRDVLDKLAWGNLYVYYEEPPLTYSSVPAQMYPIAFEEIHSGYVKGKQRLITSHPGLYGWHGDNQLHFAYLYDSRGVRIPHAFLTTVDPAGVRTQVDLAKDQCAVVKKTPLTIRSVAPVNLHIARYDDEGIELRASGTSPASLALRSGDFPVEPGAEYVLKTGTEQRRVVADAAGSLWLPLELGEEVQLSITAAKVRQ